MLKVKPFREKPGLCGPASLKMVLGYFGVRKSEQELARLCNCKEGSGTKAENILKIAKKFGLKGFIKDFSEISDIKKYVIGREIPIIVDWFSTEEGHYSVVVGIDKENIYLQDPELGHVRYMKIGTFKRIWFDFPGDFLRSKNDIIVRRMIVIYK